MPYQVSTLKAWITTHHLVHSSEPAIRAALAAAFPSRQGGRNMEIFVGQNLDAPSVFSVIAPMTDHRWRGFCDCGAPRDHLCRLDEEKVEAVVARFRAWAYVRVTEISQVVGPRRGPWILNYLSYDRQGMTETGARMRWRGRTMAMNHFLVAWYQELQVSAV
ncbi:MAG: hypothetical protein ASARMPRED_008395 [Alectoria sarmentosa]|nr:MAG: hypothetical protein ASARMPRED_008395 [Alectoria sarmentosa]